MTKSVPVRIAIAGHANVGKTTLTRNMVRSQVGKIENRPNVTKESEPYRIPLSTVYMVDCPGFNEAGRILDLIETHGVGPDLEENLIKKDLAEDWAAVKGLDGADVVIYVGTDAVSPDKGHRSELQLVRTLSKNVIGLINKKNYKNDIIRKNEKENLKAWKNLFINNGINSIIKYDLLWDSPEKPVELLSIAANHLVGIKQQSIYDCLTAIKIQKKQVAGKFLKSAKKTLKVLSTIKRNIKVDTNIDDDEYDDLTKSYRISILKEIEEELEKVSSITLDIFGLESISNVPEGEVSVSNNLVGSNKIERAVRYTAIAAPVSGWIAVIGAMKMAVAVGTVVAAGPILAFTGAATLVAGFVGGVKSSTERKKVSLKLNDKQLAQYSHILLQILWIACNQGFGNSPSIDFKEAGVRASSAIDKVAKKYDLSDYSDDNFLDKLEHAIHNVMGIQT